MQHTQQNNERNEDGNPLQELQEEEEEAFPDQLLPDESYTSEESQAGEQVTEGEQEAPISESADAAKHIKPLKGILKRVARLPKHPEVLKKSVSFSLDNLTSAVKERGLYMGLDYHNFCTRLSVLRPCLCPHDETGYVDADREYETEDDDTAEGISIEDTYEYLCLVCEYERAIREDKREKNKKPKDNKAKRKKARDKARTGGHVNYE